MLKKRKGQRFSDTLFFLMQRAVVFWHAAFSTWKQMSLANCHFSNLTKIVLREAGERLWGWGELQRLCLAALEYWVLIAACSLVQVSRELFFLALTQPSPCSDTDVAPAALSNAARRIQCHTQRFVIHLSLLGGLATDEIKCLEKHEMQGFI